jgi:hypothetical protein
MRLADSRLTPIAEDQASLRKLLGERLALSATQRFGRPGGRRSATTGDLGVPESSSHARSCVKTVDPSGPDFLESTLNIEGTA